MENIIFQISLLISEKEIDDSGLEKIGLMRICLRTIIQTKVNLIEDI